MESEALTELEDISCTSPSTIRALGSLEAGGRNGEPLPQTNTIWRSLDSAVC
jgi:hypothetical protein